MTTHEPARFARFAKANAVDAVDAAVAEHERVDAEPVALHLRVPSYDPVPALAEGETATLTGHFALDLRRLTSLLTRPQTYAVWALAGEQLSPCVKMALVTESMLPGSD